MDIFNRVLDLAPKSEWASCSTFFADLYSNCIPPYVYKIINPPRYTGLSCWDKLRSTLLRVESALFWAPYYWCHLSLQAQAFPLSQITRAEAWVGFLPANALICPPRSQCWFWRWWSSFLPGNPSSLLLSERRLSSLCRPGLTTERAGLGFIQGNEQSMVGHTPWEGTLSMG